MQIQLEFYAALRDAVGETSTSETVPEGTTISETLRTVSKQYESLDSLLFRENGSLRSHVTIALNGEPLFEGREDVTLSDGDTLVLSPGVSGGTTMAPTAEVAR